MFIKIGTSTLCTVTVCNCQIESNKHQAKVRTHNIWSWCVHALAGARIKYKISQDKLNRKKWDTDIHKCSYEVTVKIVHWCNYYGVCARVYIYVPNHYKRSHRDYIDLSFYSRLTNSKITHYIARLSSRLAWQYKSVYWYAHTHMKQVCKLSTVQWNIR